MNLGIWCDQCDDWVCDFIPVENEIKCALCGNTLIRKLPACKIQELQAVMGAGQPKQENPNQDIIENMNPNG